MDLDTLNTKLDTIIELLKPPTVAQPKLTVKAAEAKTFAVDEIKYAPKRFEHHNGKVYGDLSIDELLELADAYDSRVTWRKSKDATDKNIPWDEKRAASCRALADLKRNEVLYA